MKRFSQNDDWTVSSIWKRCRENGDWTVSSIMKRCLENGDWTESSVMKMSSENSDWTISTCSIYGKGAVKMVIGTVSGIQKSVLSIVYCHFLAAYIREHFQPFGKLHFNRYMFSDPCKYCTSDLDPTFLGILPQICKDHAEFLSY